MKDVYRLGILEVRVSDKDSATIVNTSIQVVSTVKCKDLLYLLTMQKGALPLVEYRQGIYWDNDELILSTTSATYRIYHTYNQVAELIDRLLEETLLK